MSNLISRGFGLIQRIITRGFFSRRQIGFLRGELSVTYAYSSDTVPTNALTGEASVTAGLTGETEITGN